MDDDDKARRNLVVASALVMASAWLEIPFSSVIQKFVDHSITTPDSSRVLAAGLAILAYMGLRYRASDEGDVYSEEVNKQTRKIRAKHSGVMIARHLNNFMRSGVQPSTIKSDLNSWLVAYDALKPAESQSSPTSKFKVEYVQYLDDGLIEVECLLDDRIFRDPEATHKNLRAAITGFRKLALEVKVQAELWSISKASIRHLVPVSMACIATAILIFKVWHAYWIAS